MTTSVRRICIAGLKVGTGNTGNHSPLPCNVFAVSTCCYGVTRKTGVDFAFLASPTQSCAMFVSDAHHKCVRTCHEGECGACDSHTMVTCRCGALSKDLPCQQLKLYTGQWDLLIIHLHSNGFPSVLCVIWFAHVSIVVIVLNLECSICVYIWKNSLRFTCDEGTSFTEENPFTCDKRCNKKRTCAMHKCGKTCCVVRNHHFSSRQILMTPIEILFFKCFFLRKRQCSFRHEKRAHSFVFQDQEHRCDLICGKRLTCGLHRCEEPCHRGNCPICWHVSKY